MNEVYIVAAKRTPTGGFLGSLSHLSATELGAIVIKDVYQSAGLDPSNINSVYMGNVLSANLGQSPARQSAIFAGIPDKTDATTINKVCASGMKATMLAAQQIQLGLEEIAVSGGMESMSNVPHYSYQRKGLKMGDVYFTDGLLKDGLTDVYKKYHMGNAAELCAREFKLTRGQQDDYAISSYKKVLDATTSGRFKNEIVPISINEKKESYLVDSDEDIEKIIYDKVSKLKPIFETNGTITAANASNLNDGAAAILLASKESVEKHKLTPHAKIISYADAAQAPVWFTTSPSLAITKALKQANLTLDDIDYFELNEAYAAVVLANQQLLKLNPEKLNLYGGAVAMGHPLGSSGARIIVTLISVLKQEGGKYGVASICNGGGGASAIVIENL